MSTLATPTRSARSTDGGLARLRALAFDELDGDAVGFGARDAGDAGIGQDACLGVGDLHIFAAQLQDRIAQAQEVELAAARGSNVSRRSRPSASRQNASDAPVSDDRSTV